MNKLLNTVLLLTLVGGCSTPGTIKDAEQVATDSSIVFGSIEVFEDGKQQEWGTRFFGHDHFYLLILPAGTSDAISYKLDDTGKFACALPAGEYTLLGYVWDSDVGKRTGRIGTQFTSPEPGDSTYIGSIIFSGNVAYLIPAFEDRFETLAAYHDSRFPGRQGKAAKQLMAEAESLGTINAYRGACNEDWQIGCTKRFRGVTPMSPDVAQSGFPLANSLTPEFKWKGCPKSDVSYDLVVYEAAAYSVAGALTPSYMRGRLVAYVENLNEPRWTPGEPLKPDTRYIWSVRLREGDTVSGWSTQSHSTFLLVYASWGHGQWFQFKTG